MYNLFLFLWFLKDKKLKFYNQHIFDDRIKKLTMEVKNKMYDVGLELEFLEKEDLTSRKLKLCSRHVDELLAYSQRYQMFSETTNDLMKVKQKLNDLEGNLKEESKMDMENEEMFDGVEDDLICVCGICHGRILWLSWEGLVRFANIYNIVKIDQECARCKQKITYSGGVDNSWIFVGIHVEQLQKEHDLIRPECGPVCSLCGGKQGIKRVVDSKNSVIIAYRFCSTGELQFTRHVFFNGIPSTESQICIKLKTNAVKLYTFCNKYLHPQSIQTIRENSRLIPIGKVHCCQSKNDLDGETIKLYLFHVSLTRSHLTRMIDHQTVIFFVVSSNIIFSIFR